MFRWMENREKEKVDDWNILKISTFYEHSPLLQSFLPPSQTYSNTIRVPNSQFPNIP